MDGAAVDKAKDRFADAKARLKDLESSKNYEVSRRLWYGFLLSSNSVFSILEQGAKGSEKSKNWFGKKTRERKVDPLLCYLLHARNADEHAVPSVTGLDRQKIVLVEGDKPTAAIEGMVGNTGSFRNLSDQPVNLSQVTAMRIYPDRAKLIRVKDRGMEYDPPTEHLGASIEDNGPIAVAKLMIQYIEAMISEAYSLVIRS